MSEFHPPLLVYDRIDRNKKIVRRLLLAFTLLMLPVVSAGAVFLLPFVAFFGGIAAYAVYGQGLKRRSNRWIVRCRRTRCRSFGSCRPRCC